MKSVELKNKINSPNTPYKVRALIAGSTATAGVIYYCKPKIRSKLLGATLTLLTNTGNGTFVDIHKTTITDSSLQPETIQISTNVTASDVSDSHQFRYTLPNGALTTTLFQPVASKGITDAHLTVDPDASTGNAVKIHITDLGSGSEVMTGILELEFLPV